jgi:hypothetical protein
MKIVCPNCHVPLAAEDVNLSTGLARCRTCNNVFRFDNSPELSAAARPRPRMDQPRGLVVADAAGRLTIEFRWFTMKYVFLAVFCVFWDGFLLFWYMTAIASGNAIMLVFPILHVLVGAILTYVTAAGFLNRTTLTIDGNRLRVRVRPLPLVRSVDLVQEEVKQLFCEQRISRGRYGVYYTYDLTAQLRDGTRRKLLSGLDTADLPLYLEQHCEEWMQITDVPVAGELAR